MEVVAVTPLMTVVRIPLAAASVELLIKEVEEETPFMIEVSVLTAEKSELLLMKLAVVVATFPLTVEVRTKELVEVETVSVFEVEDATRLVRSVVVATPLMVVVRTAPDVERAFDEMTEEVAVTPLMIVVSVLPDRDCVKELMIVARVEEIPLTIVWKTLRDDEATFEVMIEDVPIDPPMLEVSVLPEAERELVVVMEGAMREEMVVVARVEVPVTVKNPVVVELVVVRLVKEAFRADKREEKNPVEDVAFVVVRLVMVPFVP